jgi:imidazole glycerol-phosphate synthase subunit HisH
VIALIDYRAGNLTSVKKALAAVGAEVVVPERPQDLHSADAVIVPGVGHFGATRALDESWLTAIRAGVTAGKPLLGICLGMQWLFDASDEAPDLKGLGVFRGSCTRLPGSDPSQQGSANVIKVPHVGWNSLARSGSSTDAWIAHGIRDGVQVYFTHSYVAPVTPDAVATTRHGDCFAAIVERGSVAGVQFHPEKSGEAGLQILRNFVARSAVH